jgi:hypothetical protein
LIFFDYNSDRGFLRKNVMSQDVVSFVIRFVREASEDEEARWRGVIKHVQGNQENHFSQFAEAVAFMQTYVNQLAENGAADENRETAADSPDNPFLETARLWREFMPRYTRLMMASMGQAMGGGSNLPHQMEEAMSAGLALWGIPTDKERRQTAVALEALANQLSQLTGKMEQLEKEIAKLKREA